MPSFKTIFAIAAFAFAGFSAAAPATPVADVAFAKRAEAATSNKDLVTVLTQANASLRPLCDKLNAAVDVQVGVEIDINVVILPVIDEIKVVLGGCIGDIRGLTKLVKYDVHVVANLVGELLVLIFATLGTVLKIVGSVKAKLLIPILGGLCDLIATLLGLVLGLVGGLLIFLIPTILHVIPIILEINVVSLLRVLGLGGGLLKFY